MRQPRMTTRRWMIAVGIAAVLSHACVPISAVSAARIVAVRVRAKYPGIDLAEYDIRVGGPDRWHSWVRLRLLPTNRRSFSASIDVTVQHAFMERVKKRPPVPPTHFAMKGRLLKELLCRHLSPSGEHLGI